MSAPQYSAMGGVIFTREHMPLTLERAHQIKLIHLRNAQHWLQSDAYSQTARLGMAKLEQSLADEMDAALSEAVSELRKIAA